MGLRRRLVLACAPIALGLVLLSGATAHAARKRPPPPEPVPYGAREDVVRFAEDVASRQPELDAAWVREQLERARRVPAVAQLIMPPPAGTAKNWAAYRARFIERERITAGVAFWRAHASWLARAEARWGVPPELVVGIIGVETFYGRLTGSFRVIDALATLSFDFPAGRRDRTPFFRSELEEFLLWCARERCDPQAVKGSFAGALGLPQFMPGSINRYAIDFDEDGRTDLSGSAADAIGSVAHYLAAFGWQRDLPTHFRVAVPVEVSDRAALLAPDIVPTFSAAEFAARGAALEPRAHAHEGPLALVELQNGDAAPSYVAGTRNFFAVTRYNWSSYYAMAVIELGQAVAHRLRVDDGPADGLSSPARASIPAAAPTSAP
ncbi:MAG TPA: lytic murein transglycosylase B [Burkholderiaceae bacterium]|nr:lytic murein transglycosylase B [Burkholderiaceae bacterium]